MPADAVPGSMIPEDADAENPAPGRVVVCVRVIGQRKGAARPVVHWAALVREPYYQRPHRMVLPSDDAARDLSARASPASPWGQCPVLGVGWEQRHALSRAQMR
jgi:hypothetical protein